MRIKRNRQLLPNAEALQPAFMSWMEKIVARTPAGAPLNLITDLEAESDSLHITYVWCGEDLVGVSRAVEVFRGGEWMHTVYDIEGDDD